MRPPHRTQVYGAGWSRTAGSAETDLHADAEPAVEYPVVGRDLSALIGIVGSLEAQSRAGELDAGLERSLIGRLIQDDLLPATADDATAMQVALGNLAQRLHAAYGAYPDGPPQSPLP